MVGRSSSFPLPHFSSPPLLPPLPPLPPSADSLIQLLDEKFLNDSLETKCPPKHKGMVVFFSKF